MRTLLAAVKTVFSFLFAQIPLWTLSQKCSFRAFFPPRDGQLGKRSVCSGAEKVTVDSQKNAKGESNKEMGQNAIKSR